MSGDGGAVTAGRGRERWLSAAVGFGASALLGVAAWLEPAAEGHSTHLQLGLLPCTFFVVTGIPCPMCGATTTFALLADGRIVDGLANQPFAALLFVGTIGVAMLGWVEAIAPRDRWRRISDATIDVETRLVVLLLVSMMLGWTWKIAAMW